MSIDQEKLNAGRVGCKKHERPRRYVEEHGKLMFLAFVSNFFLKEFLSDAVKLPDYGHRHTPLVEE